MQERQFERPVLGEQSAGVLAVRDGGEEFEQEGLGVFHLRVGRNGSAALEQIY